MDVPNNIERFNCVVAKGLLHLYEAFPVPVDLNISAIAVDCFPEPIEDDSEWDLIWNHEVRAAFVFLAQEGFIRYDDSIANPSRDVLRAACLTMKGLSVLGMMPEAVDGSRERRPIAVQLREALDSGAGDAVASTVGKMFFFTVSRLLTT